MVSQKSVMHYYCHHAPCTGAERSPPQATRGACVVIFIRRGEPPRWQRFHPHRWSPVRGSLIFSPVCGAQRSCSSRNRPASFEVPFTWTGLIPAHTSQRSCICFIWTTSTVTPFHKVHYFLGCPSFRYQHKLKSLKWVGGDLHCDTQNTRPSRVSRTTYVM